MLVTFRREEKKKTDIIVTWMRREEAEEGWRWVTVSSVARRGAELPVIDIWQLIITAFCIAFLVTGHNVAEGEKKEEISFHEDGFGFSSHTHTHTHTHLHTTNVQIWLLCADIKYLHLSDLQPFLPTCTSRWLCLENQFFQPTEFLLIYVINHHLLLLNVFFFLPVAFYLWVSLFSALPISLFSYFPCSISNGSFLFSFYLLCVFRAELITTHLFLLLNVSPLLSSSFRSLM